jgi:hypothetical protein
LKHTSRTRSIVAAIFGILCVLTITAGLLLGYVTRALFNPSAFANRAAQSLANEGVARLVATRITDRLIENRRDLIAFRPILIGTTQSVVSSAPFRAIVRRAARTSHQLLISEKGKNLTLTVADAGVILRSAFASNPQLANKIPSRLTTVISSARETPGGSNFIKLLHLVIKLRLGALALLLFGIVAGILCVVLAHEKRLTILRIGIALALVSLILTVLIRFGGYALALFAKDQLVGDGIAGFWGAFFGGFMIWALVLGLIGLILTAAVTSVLEKVQFIEIFNIFRQWLKGLEKNTAIRVVRIFLLLAVGALVALFPLAAMHILILLAGMLIFFIGIREFFKLILSSLPQIKRATQKELGPERTSTATYVVVGILALMFIGSGLYFLFRSETANAVQQNIDLCNGFAELCDRRLNEVVFPAAHNAMSAADIPKWMFPNHEKGIGQQLQDGIRALLIDTHYGSPVEDRIKTLLDNEEVAKKKYEAALGKEGVEAAMRIRDRLIGTGDEKTGIYLCHGFCELGATSLLSTFREMREFLIANPHEVIIIINQDEGVTPQSFEAAFKETSLIDFVYRGRVGPPWPTLREMIASDQRILVFAENDSKGVQWYHPVFESMQETPYSFHDPKEFSCKENRGGSSGSLFLLNHWIDSTPAPKPSNAQIVNSYDFLLKRAQQCKEQRKLMPNLIAVDFYKTGNLMDVVQTLNGIQGENL